MIFWSIPIFFSVIYHLSIYFSISLSISHLLTSMSLSSYLSIYLTIYLSIINLSVIYLSIMLQWSKGDYKKPWTCKWAKFLVLLVSAHVQIAKCWTFTLILFKVIVLFPSHFLKPPYPSKKILFLTFSASLLYITSLKIWGALRNLENLILGRNYSQNKSVYPGMHRTAFSCPANRALD